MVDPLQLLTALPSWRLERLSKSTFPHDVLLRGSDGLTKKEVEAVIGHLKRGVCYRCRIGRGRFHYGETAVVAIAAAVKSKKAR